MSLKTSDEKQDLILKVFDYFETESKLSLGESEMKTLGDEKTKKMLFFSTFILYFFYYI
jgi:hypothetical protein